MSNRTMLKEAIADAKTIKETAIANAKAALEESFTPHIKEMLSAKLQEMDKDEDLDEGKKEDSKDKMDEMDAPSYKRKGGDSLQSMPDKVGKSTIQEEEIELDEMLAELDAEMSEGKDEEKSKTELKEDDSVNEADEDIDVDVDVEGDDEIDLDDEEVDLEDMSEDDLKGFIEDVIKDMVDDGDLEPGDEFESEEVVDDVDVEDIDVDMDIEIEDEVELDEAYGGNKGDERKGDMKKKGHYGSGPKKKDTAKEEDEIDYVKEALAEVDKLKVELNEVNLLNAKLLYTNKLFRAKNLSEAQKVKVLESFDNATTVKETKLVFDTLSEGIKSAPKRTINEVKGSASKALGSIKKPTKQPIVESNDMVARFQKLAGII